LNSSKKEKMIFLYKLISGKTIFFYNEKTNPAGSKFLNSGFDVNPENKKLL